LFKNQNGIFFGQNSSFFSSLTFNIQINLKQNVSCQNYAVNTKKMQVVFLFFKLLDEKLETNFHVLASDIPK